MKALILLADQFEDLELYYPWFRLLEEQATVTLAAPGIRYCKGLHGLRVEPDVPMDEVNPSEYELLIIPGGYAPATLRLNETAVAIARNFMEEERTVAALSHGPQLLLSAGTLNGRRLACAASIRDDVRAAGAEYRPEGIVVDGNLVTCRGTDDLPRFCHTLLDVIHTRA
jgi:protease I